MLDISKPYEAAMSVSLDALRSLCAVADTGSFSAAALRLHRSQPAISQQIKALETRTGQILIERDSGRPTDAGRIALRRAREAIAAADALTGELADLSGAASSELRIGASDTVALYLLPELVKRFVRRFPETRLTLLSRSSAEVSTRVIEGALDLGIVTLPQPHPDLETRELPPLSLVLAVPAKHPLAKRKRIGLGALAGESFLMLDEATRTGAQIKTFFHAASFAPQTVIDSGSFEVIKRYVAEGIGVAILPEAVLRPADRRIAAVAIPGLPATAIGIVTRRGAYRSHAAGELIASLTESP